MSECKRVLKPHGSFYIAIGDDYAANVKIIAASSNPGDCVLDPFSGSGTTAAAAYNMGRDYVGVSDVDDAFPLDSTESSDNDGDGVGDNADTDDDNDGLPDVDDWYSLDPDENTNGILDGIDAACSPDADWKNHGQYMSCVAQTAEQFLVDGLITETEKDAIVSAAAAQSDVGKKKGKKK